MKDYTGLRNNLRFSSIIDGDYINDFDIIYDSINNRELLKVIIKTDKERNIAINNVLTEALKDKTQEYSAYIPVKVGENSLVAVDLDTKESTTITAFYKDNTVDKFRISVDDIILCLQDLTKNHLLIALLTHRPIPLLHSMQLLLRLS